MPTSLELADILRRYMSVGPNHLHQAAVWRPGRFRREKFDSHYPMPEPPGES